MTLSSEEIARYARHIVLPEIGGAGQQRLGRAKVLVVGAGGIGSPAILYLAASGIGTIGIADDDDVTLSNLQRQTIHTTADLGRPKTASAAEAAGRLNPHVAVEAHPFRLDESNVAATIAPYDVVLDGSDNFPTRFLLADACAAAGVPLVSAAVNRFSGSLTTLLPFADENPSYRDLFPEPPPEGLVPTCAEAGVLGAVTGILGTLAVAEVVKLLCGFGEPLVGRLLMVDALDMRFQTITYRRKATKGEPA